MGLPTGFDSTHGAAADDDSAAGTAPEADGVNVGPVLHTANAEDFHDGVGAKLVQFAFDAFPQMKWSKNKFRGEAHLGRVRVNGKMAGANQRLQEGDVVTVHKEKIAKGPTKGINSKVRARQEAQVARSDGPGPDEEFSQSLDAEGRCTKRRNGIVCGCPDCASLSEAEKKKIRNRKKKLAQERKKALLAEEGAAAGSAGETDAPPGAAASGAAASMPADSTTHAAAVDSSTTAASASADPAQPYPEGWRFGGRSAPTPDAPAGVPYYHSPSGATSWDPPVILPEGWTQSVEATSCRSWYEHAATGTKSWTPPEGSCVCVPPPSDASGCTGAAPAAAAAAAAALASSGVAAASSAEQMLAAAAAAVAAQAATRPGLGSSLSDAGTSKRKAPEATTTGSSSVTAGRTEAESEESELEDEEDEEERVGVAKTTARIRKKPALRGQGQTFLQMKTKIVNGAGGKMLSQDSDSDSD